MENIKYIGTRDCLINTSKFHFYTIVINNYEMGLEVLDDRKGTVMVTLFHWENEHERVKLRHSVNNTEKLSFLQLYYTKKDRRRYFNYNGTRVHLPV